MRIFATSAYICTLFFPRCLFLLSLFFWTALAGCSYWKNTIWDPYLHWLRLADERFPSGWLDVCSLFSRGGKNDGVFGSFLWDHSVSLENNPTISCLIASVLKARLGEPLAKVSLKLSFSSLISENETGGQGCGRWKFSSLARVYLIFCIQILNKSLFSTSCLSLLKGG